MLLSLACGWDYVVQWRKLIGRWANNSIPASELETVLHFDLDRVRVAHVRMVFSSAWSAEDWGGVGSTISAKEEVSTSWYYISIDFVTAFLSKIPGRITVRECIAMQCMTEFTKLSGILQLQHLRRMVWACSRRGKPSLVSLQAFVLTDPLLRSRMTFSVEVNLGRYHSTSIPFWVFCIWLDMVRNLLMWNNFLISLSAEEYN